MKQSIYNTALYLRLSRDDDNAGESNSIATQRMMLRRYAEQNHLYVVDEYIDDGYSGTNFNRPSFQRMITDIEAGRINCVVVKDLSRFGRNYLEMGMYTEMRFPELGVRFIAVDSGVDSNNQQSTEFTPFLNVINEWYVRDSSRKVRAVLRAKAERGERIGSRAPYGYRKDENDKKKLVVDEEAAVVVRRIFAMCAAGTGPMRIAKELQSEQILCPTAYMYRKYGITHTKLDLGEPYHWSGDTIRVILENEVYLGNTINMRYSTKSYKDKRRIEHPRDECLVFEGTHPALVSTEIWDIVQRVRQNKRGRNNFDEQDKYSGLLVCADCGNAMVLHRSHGRDPSRYHFSCYTYKRRGSDACISHYIRECILDDVVLEDLRQVTVMAREHTREFAEYIGSRQSAEIQREVCRLEKELFTMRRRSTELDTIFKKLYEDVCCKG